MDKFNSRFAAISIAGALYHIIFTFTEAARLIKTPKSPYKVHLIECKILGEHLDVIAEGRAVHVPPDEYSAHIGVWLALARALDFGREVEGWTYEDTAAVIELFWEVTDLNERLEQLPEDVWFGPFLQSDTNHEAEAKVLILALDELAAKTEASEPQPAAATGVWEPTKSSSQGILRPTKVIDVPARRTAGIGDASTDSANALHQSPREDAQVPADSLLLNDQFRRDAERMGIRLDYPAGALTMSDLSRLYHAMKRTQLAEEKLSRTLPVVDRNMEQAADLIGPAIEKFLSQVDVPLGIRTLVQLAEDAQNMFVEAGGRRYEPIVRTGEQFVSAYR